MSRYLELDDDGELIRLIRCPKCGQIVARVYGDIEVRFRVLDHKERTGHGARPWGGWRGVSNAYVSFPKATEDYFRRAADCGFGARCAPCHLTYDLREVVATARRLVKNDQRSAKMPQRSATV